MTSGDNNNDQTQDDSNAKAAAGATGCFMLILFLLSLPFLIVSLPVVIVVGIAYLLIGGLASAKAYSDAKLQKEENSGNHDANACFRKPLRDSTANPL